ncbi:hypothetical protein RvY_15317 [Ramazzottius varieornatus]|uniref:Uncharacterized protein n=1 Tax=Ramazzottius varieornatus TaxID=947166 RepID=A0A1D1VVS6_RAMVA|nr:hypothetical protein RvY_15317 [Ramazzottius varieornatus]
MSLEPHRCYLGSRRRDWSIVAAFVICDPPVATTLALHPMILYTALRRPDQSERRHVAQVETPNVRSDLERTARLDETAPTN